jgi:hypothetical protein
MHELPALVPLEKADDSTEDHAAAFPTTALIASSMV